MLNKKGRRYLSKTHTLLCCFHDNKKIVFDMCAYLIQVSELQTHFGRIKTCIHIPKINSLCCIGHCPRCMCITDKKISGKVNHIVVKPRRSHIAHIMFNTLSLFIRLFVISISNSSLQGCCAMSIDKHRRFGEISASILWVQKSKFCLIHPEDGASKFLLNCPNNLPIYTITHPRSLNSSPTQCD